MGKLNCASWFIQFSINTTDNILSYLKIPMINKEQVEHKIYGHSECIITEFPKLYFITLLIILLLYINDSYVYL